MTFYTLANSAIDVYELPYTIILFSLLQNFRAQLVQQLAPVFPAEIKAFTANSLIQERK